MTVALKKLYHNEKVTLKKRVKFKKSLEKDWVRDMLVERSEKNGFSDTNKKVGSQIKKKCRVILNKNRRHKYK